MRRVERSVWMDGARKGQRGNNYGIVPSDCGDTVDVSGLEEAHPGPVSRMCCYATPLKKCATGDLVPDGQGVEPGVQGFARVGCHPQRQAALQAAWRNRPGHMRADDGIRYSCHLQQRHMAVYLLLYITICAS